VSLNWVPGSVSGSYVTPNFGSQNITTSGEIVGDVVRASSQLRSPAGTAGLPAYSFFGESNTGIYRDNGVNISHLGLAICNFDGLGTFGSGRRVQFGGGASIATTSGAIRISPVGNLELEGGGVISQVSYDATTAAGANVTLNASAKFLRSTSSIKYKTQVEDVDALYSENIILKSRPVWYRSLCQEDPSQHSYWGFIAEEVAEIDPRMVFWGDDGPEGVQYDRYVVHLVKMVQQQKNRIDELTSKVEQLSNLIRGEGEL
jgi:hypothetical protein